MSDITNKKMIDEIKEVANDVLNGWEIDFIESVSEKDDVEKLTEKQQACLDKIYQKVCDSPF
jgi:hypothetical protein